MIDYGTNAADHMLSLVLFDIGPAIIDMTVAVIFFSFYFDWIIGTLVFIAIALYIGNIIFFIILRFFLNYIFQT